MNESQMSIWKALYAMVWLAFLEIAILFFRRFTIAPLVAAVDAHVVLGLAILRLAYYDNAAIKKTQAPDRLKRIVKDTLALAVFQIVLGAPLYLNLRFLFGFPFVEVVDFLHLVIALAIITQAASVATAYDMWEEHEFTLLPKPL
jgi:hypothetical protein